jgi:hypothetical protein
MKTKLEAEIQAEEARVISRWWITLWVAFSLLMFFEGRYSGMHVERVP